MRFLTFLMLISAAEFTLAWMDKIPSNQLLSQLTIPGTHNSYARHGTIFHQCQDWTISEQLNNGIRFFDVRFRPYERYFTVHHGNKFQKKYGGHVFKDFKQFLQNNPKETVLISIRDETRGNNLIDPYPGSLDFKTILNSYLNDKKYKPYIYQNHKVIPTLGEARGKMVIIDKDGHCGFGLNRLEKTDDWKLDGQYFFQNWRNSQMVKDKVDGIKKSMQGAGKNRRKRSHLFLTFCSGSNAKGLVSNRAISEHINPQVKSFIRSHSASQKETFGVVIFDYPTRDIIQFLIQQNPNQKKVCAVVEDEGRTKSWNILKGATHLYLGGIGWNDEIAYVNLAKGCYLRAWADMNKKGRTSYIQHKKDRNLIEIHRDDYEIKDDGWVNDDDDDGWANDISSLHCNCP